MIELIKAEIKKSIEVKHQVLQSKEILTQLEVLVNECLKSLNNGGKIIFVEMVGALRIHSTLRLNLYRGYDLIERRLRQLL